MTVVLSGDGRLVELLRQEYLVPLGSRIRTRLVTEAASRESCWICLSHALSKAGNAALMTAELMDTLVDHSAGNYRVLMIDGAASCWPMAWPTRSRSSTRSAYLEVFQPKQHTPRDAEEGEGVTMPMSASSMLPVVRVGEIPERRDR